MDKQEFEDEDDFIVVPDKNIKNTTEIKRDITLNENELEVDDMENVFDDIFDD